MPHKCLENRIFFSLRDDSFERRNSCSFSRKLSRRSKERNGLTRAKISAPNVLFFLSPTHLQAKSVANRVERRRNGPLSGQTGKKTICVGQTKISDRVPGLFQPFLRASFQQQKVFRALDCRRPQFFKCLQKLARTTQERIILRVPLPLVERKSISKARAFCNVTVKGYIRKKLFPVYFFHLTTKTLSIEEEGSARPMGSALIAT